MIITIRGEKDEDINGIAHDLLSYFNIEQQYSAEVRNGKNVTRMPHARSKGHVSILVTIHSNKEEPNGQEKSE